MRGGRRGGRLRGSALRPSCTSPQVPAEGESDDPGVPPGEIKCQGQAREVLRECVRVLRETTGARGIVPTRKRGCTLVVPGGPPPRYHVATLGSRNGDPSDSAPVTGTDALVGGGLMAPAGARGDGVSLSVLGCSPGASDGPCVCGIAPGAMKARTRGSPYAVWCYRND